MSLPQVLQKRLSGFHDILCGAYNSGSKMSSASKGNERELFVTTFLEAVFPSSYRFGTGDIIDSEGNQSGQLDLVLEYPFLPSFPVFGKDTPRLYLADGIAVVIEVKSNLENQWGEVLATHNKVAKLKRDVTSAGHGSMPGTRIPFIAVGYFGWTKPETILSKVKDSGIDGILCLDSKTFANHQLVKKYNLEEVVIAENVVQGEEYLWQFLKYLHKRLGSIASMYVELDSYTD